MSKSDYEEVILELFDACPTRSQVTYLAKMYCTSDESILELLQKNGRDINFKRGRRPKAKTEEVKETKEEVSEDLPEQLSKAAEHELPIPEYVKELVMKEMDSLEEQLKVLEKETLEKQQKYTVLANFIKN